MPSPKRRAQLGAADAARAGAAPPAKTATGADDVETKRLDALTTESQILNPEPSPIMVGDRALDLHPLSASYSRKFTGFVAQLTAEAFGRGSFTTRLQGVLAENDALRTRFCGYAARAVFPPDAIDLENMGAIAAEIGERCSYLQLSILLDRMVSMNDTMAQLFPPKQKPGA